MDGPAVSTHHDRGKAGVFQHIKIGGGKFHRTFVIHDDQRRSAQDTQGGIGAGIGQEQRHRQVAIEIRIVDQAHLGHDTGDAHREIQDQIGSHVIIGGAGRVVGGRESHAGRRVGKTDALDRNQRRDRILIRVKQVGRELKRGVVVVDEHRGRGLAAQRNAPGRIGQHDREGLGIFDEQIVDQRDDDVLNRLAGRKENRAVGPQKIDPVGRGAVEDLEIDRCRKVRVARAQHREDGGTRVLEEMITLRGELQCPVVRNEDDRGAGRTADGIARPVQERDNDRLGHFLRGIIQRQQREHGGIRAGGNRDGVIHPQRAEIVAAGRRARDRKRNGQRQIGRPRPRDDELSGLGPGLVRQGRRGRDRDAIDAHVDDGERVGP